MARVPYGVQLSQDVGVGIHTSVEAEMQKQEKFVDEKSNFELFGVRFKNTFNVLFSF